MLAFRNNISAGIECNISANGETTFYCVLLKEHKGKVEIVSEKIFKEFSDELLRYIPASYPVNLCITGKGIIIRPVEADENIKWNELLNKCLPNAQVNDFYIQKFSLTGRETNVSVIRRSVADELSSRFKGRLITGLFIGPFQSILFKHMNRDAEPFKIRNYSLKLSDGVLRKVESSQNGEQTTESFAIGEASINSDLFFSYLSASQFLIAINGNQSNINSIESNRSEYFDKIKFNKYTLITASVFLFLLICNFLFTHQTQESINQLRSELSSNSILSDSVTRLMDQLEKKKSVIYKSGLLENTKFSYYIDQLAYDLPQSITFTEIRINPIKKINDGDEYEVERGRILIKGTGENSELSEWMKELKRKSWIKQIQIQNYDRNAESGEGEFQLTMKI